MRIDNLEFRRNQTGRDAEIVCWETNGDGQEYCYTLLWYQKDSEGYYIQFVGRRPLDHKFDNALWGVMEYGQDVLDAEFKLEESLKWK
jgi:hypothetical protein